VVEQWLRRHDPTCDPSTAIQIQGVAMTNAPDEPQAPVNPDAGEAPDPVHEPDDEPRFAPEEDADTNVLLPDSDESQS
jgi:hypothetical protein